MAKSKSTPFGTSNGSSHLFQIVKALPAGLERLHLTFVTPDGVSTFASDNTEHLEAWWLVQCAKLHNPSRKNYYVVLNKREFTAMKDSQTGLPIRKLSSCLFRDGAVIPLTADQTRSAFHTCPNTGKPLPVMTDVVFVDLS